MVRVILLIALVASACVATPPLVMGESAPPMTLPPASLGVVVLDHDGVPLAGASLFFTTVTAEGEVITDESGRATVRWHEDGVELRADAPAHEETVLVVSDPDEQEGDIRFRLEPTILDGIVTGVGGAPLAGARVALGTETTVTAADGGFWFVGVDADEVVVSRPAYEPGATEWTGSGQVAVSLDPFIVRGVYVNPSQMSGDNWQRLLDLVRTTEINTLVIDAKSESGNVYFDSGVPLAAEIGAERVVWDATTVRADADSVGAYVIARVVAFQDPVAARARPSLAIADPTTGGPYERRGQYFLDPTDADARRYNIDLAVAACEAGIDEIQFDYVRYPDGLADNISRMRFDGSASDEDRPRVIMDFLAEAREELHERGCAVSADIFGFITRATSDGGIGQQLEMLAGVTDALSPMIYPSHYSTGWYGFTVPNDHPGPMVANALDDGLARVADMTILRPWLQDFWYDDPAQVRAQIDESEERGLGWMLWHPGSRFSTAALRSS